LLDNAIKFTPDGGHVKVTAMLDPEFTPASIVVGVSDTGPGIPAEIQKQIFQKYNQVKMIQGRRTGSGVGLYYCKLAVEAHGGQIWVDSQIGGGSTFYFRLPLAP
jgi:signal transduction histidine kinase